MMAGFFIVGIAPSYALDVQRLPAVKLETPPTIDGKIDSEEWKGVVKLTNFSDPVSGKPAVDQTDAWIAYDAEAIYVALHAHDVQPAAIVAREIQPGSGFSGEDTLTFMINPNGNKDSGDRCSFVVNALNTQRETIAGGRAAKREWRGEWKSAAQRVADGWTVEFRIPWKMLSYPSGPKCTMEIDFRRYQARTNVSSRWSSGNLLDRQEFFGLWLDVSPPRRTERNRPQFLVYSAPDYDDRKFGIRSGLDARYAFTPQLTGLLSINPDFKNIEEEIAGISFSRTERFLGEARPFFTDGRDYFSAGGGTMFYSRRIPTFDWGMKAYGQVNPTLSVGALATVSTGEQTSAVAKVNKVFGPRQSINVWFTGTERPESTSAAYGISGSFSRGNYGTSFDLMTSRSKGNASPTAGNLGVSYSIPRLYSYLEYGWTPPGFDSPLGYVAWNDRRGFYFYTNYYAQYHSGPFRDFSVYGAATKYNEYDGDDQQRGVEGTVGVTTRNDIDLSVSLYRYMFGSESENTQTLSSIFNTRNRHKRFGLSHEWGTRATKATRYTNAFMSYRLLPGLDIGASYSIFAYDDENRLGIFTLGYELGPLDSIVGRFVARDGRRNGYLTYRHSGGSGIEYFVVVGDPNAVKWRDRISVKVVWAF